MFCITGFEERIETGIDWTLVEQSARHHKKACHESVPAVSFSEALKSKIDNSIFSSFLNEESGLSLDQQWELLLPITLWDNEKFATDEGKICFHNANNITDDMVKMIKRAVAVGDRDLLRKELKMVNVLRVNDSSVNLFGNVYFHRYLFLKSKSARHFIVHLVSRFNGIFCLS